MGKRRLSYFRSRADKSVMLRLEWAMAEDGDGDGHGKTAPPIADVINLADLFATHCQLEHRGEYFRLIFSTEAIIPGTGTVESELIPSARIVMPPSGLMELAEAVLAFYVKRKG